MKKCRKSRFPDRVEGGYRPGDETATISKHQTNVFFEAHEQALQFPKSYYSPDPSKLVCDIVKTSSSQLESVCRRWHPRSNSAMDFSVDGDLLNEGRKLSITSKRVSRRGSLYNEKLIDVDAGNNAFYIHDYRGSVVVEGKSLTQAQYCLPMQSSSDQFCLYRFSHTGEKVPVAVLVERQSRRRDGESWKAHVYTAYETEREKIGTLYRKWSRYSIPRILGLGHKALAVKCSNGFDPVLMVALRLCYEAMHTAQNGPRDRQRDRVQLKLYRSRP